MMGKQDLNLIETIVLVMMENRSFDHMLGYLSLPPYNWKVDGLQSDPAWLAKYANQYKGKLYRPFNLKSLKGTKDPLHDRKNVSDQLGLQAKGLFPMTGFVKSYADKYGMSDKPAVMGYYTPSELPIINFFAQSFAVCDHWFSPLPTATQPNKLMALSGTTHVDRLSFGPGIPYTDLIYEWLTMKRISWRIYASFLPFLCLLSGWPQGFLTLDTYRPVHELKRDVTDASNPFPQVVFIEPKYTLQKVMNGHDYHAPTSIGVSERFLLEVYRALTANPERWKKTLMIVAFDEHGGFFDHVSPLLIIANPPKGATYAPFTSSGVRVPAFVISQLVRAQTVFSGPLDHTSILRLIAERFGGGSYSKTVDQRQAQGLLSVASVLNLPAPRTDIPIPPKPPAILQQVLPEKITPQVTDESQTFRWAARKLRKERPDIANKFPELEGF